MRGKSGGSIVWRLRSFVAVWAIAALAVVLSGLSGAAAAQNARPTLANGWSVNVNDDSSFDVLYRRAPVLSSEYVFWRKGWRWATPRITVKRTPEGITFKGDVRRLGLSLNGTITNAPANVLVYDIMIDASRDLSDVVGGGFQFNFELESPAFDQVPGNPRLQGRNRTWSWEAENATVSLEFDKAIPELRLERGRPNELRAMLVGKTLERGKHHFKMTLTLPEQGVLNPSLEEMYGPADFKTWYSDVLVMHDSPVDLRFLNHRPAGSKGFVKAQGDHFVFEDGTRARFWGTNLAAHAIFTQDKNIIKQQARRIAKLGYNLVRFHHHESMQWVDPTVIDLKREDTQHLDPESMGRLDYWIKCLRDEGVYVWLDLHVGRRLKPGDAQSKYGTIPGFGETTKYFGDFKGFNYYNKVIQKLMMDFNEKYLSHLNSYTGLTYRDDPAIMAVLVTNENDLTHHLGNRTLPNKRNPVHNAMFQEALSAFCDKTGLPRGQTWRTWLPGPSKIFLNNQEHLFNELMIGHLRKLGYQSNIVTTNFWGRGRLYCLPALTDSDMMDVHSYGRIEVLTTNPRYIPNFITWIGCAQIAGKPLTSSEWTVPFPQPGRFTSSLYTASVACLQDWDALMQYNYSQTPFEPPSRPSPWSTWLDPAYTGMAPAAALAYRQQHIKKANKTYFVKLDRNLTYYRGITPYGSATLRTLVEMSRLTMGLPDIPELDWDSETQPDPGAEVITDLNRDFIPEGQDFVESDTGELRRNWVKGIQTVNTSRTQAASGWIGGEKIALKDVSILSETGKASIIVTSLDNKPIAESSEVLITAMARSRVGDGQIPYLSEPVIATLRIKARSGLKIVPIGADGTEGAPLSTTYSNGAYVVVLPKDSGTLWYKMVSAA